MVDVGWASFLRAGFLGSTGHIYIKFKGLEHLCDPLLIIERLFELLGASSYWLLSNLLRGSVRHYRGCHDRSWHGLGIFVSYSCNFRVNGSMKVQGQFR